MDNSDTKYHPEPYWSDVAKRISSRKGRNVIAGDDEPYYRYKRQRFLELLHGIDFSGQRVLELGSGPGGNLQEVLRQHPAHLTGADISADMIKIADEAIQSDRLSLVKVDGDRLPFEDRSFDLSFTATVLQHNTDPVMLKRVLSELCRVTDRELILLERVEKNLKGDDLCMGRPVAYYEELCKENGFTLESTRFINTRISYFVSGAIRKLFNPRVRQEGEPITGISKWLQQLTLPITKWLDRMVNSPTDVARMIFTRVNE